jgi:signal transduction histidine kinase
MPGRLLPEVANFPDFKRGWNDLFTSLLEAKDELLHLPNGRTIRLLITPHPLGGLIFIFDDVTDRIRLQESHSMLSAVQKETIDNLYEAIVVFGEDGKLKLYNPAFAKLWNLKEDILNKEPHISEILELTKPYFAGNTGGEFKQLMIDCWSNRRAQSGRLERTDQSVVDYSVVPLPDGGSLFGYVDITDSFRVERALIERTEALEAADQLKSEFIANVSYGLRAPLTSIIGFAEILENNYFGKMNDKQHEYSRGILDASQKLHALINDILDLATIEAGYMDLQYTTFDVHVMLASIINLVRDRAASHGLNIDFECPMNIGSMSADERRLRQVLLNLIGNAINFTPPGGKVVIKGERVKDEIWMVVADTGQGITPEEQANVFEKFKRGNTKKAGAGLGLSLVKSFVELHGGSVELKSEVGKGTIIICKIPAQPAKQKAA